MEINTNTNLHIDDTTIISFGDAIKTLDDKGRVGGYLVRFGTPEEHDASENREFFAADTYYGRNLKNLDILYVHGLPNIKSVVSSRSIPNHLADRIIGDGAITRTDEVGLWIEAQMAMRDEYDEAVKAMVDAGKLSWSSGTALHRIRREPQPNGAMKLTSWPICEASLTPTPGEFRPDVRVMALKTLVGLIEGGEVDPASQNIPTPESSEPAADAAPASTWLDDALKTASDLSTTAERFAKVSPAKLEAIKTLRDSLNGLWLRHRGVDRDQLQAHRQRVEQLLSRWQ